MGEPRGVPVLADFDLCRDLQAAAPPVGVMQTTRVGMGTELYMSPEVKAGARPTASADIYAFGATVLFLFTPDLKPEVQIGGSRQPVIRVPSVCADDSALSNLLKISLTECASKRVTATQLLGDDFFKPEALLRVRHEREMQQAEKRALQKERERLCVICYDTEDVGGGVECGGSEPHFMCSACLDGTMVAATGDDNARVFAERKGLIPCPSPECDSAAFDNLTLARRASADSFRAYERARQRLHESNVNRELEATFETRVEAEVQRKAALSDAERQAREVRNHIVNDILTLACPRCKQAFVDFDGCFALKCSRAGCSCGFCAVRLFLSPPLDARVI